MAVDFAALPPAPRCLVCGHIPDAKCCYSCDVILASGYFCCDGECVYSRGDYKAWIRDAVRARVNIRAEEVVIAQGPFWAGSARSGRFKVA